MKSVSQGLPVGSLNDDIDYGAMAAETTVYKGKKHGVVKGYLRPALGRKNLHVLVHTQVVKVCCYNFFLILCFLK